MLRLSRVETDGVLVVVAEGKLMGPWVDEVRQALHAPARERRIDLGSVTFVDEAGLALLKALRREGVEVVRPTAFVEALLQRSAD